MAHKIEPASSGRAGCRGCGRKIAKDELRLGDLLPNPFGEGEMTLWFHLLCAAYKRPEVMLEAIAEGLPEGAETERLRGAAQEGVDRRRLPRIDGAERAPSGRAKCRGCHEKIDKLAWRIRISFFEGERFVPSGFVHVSCSGEYFETPDVLERLLHFTQDLSSEDAADLGRALGA